MRRPTGRSFQISPGALHRRHPRRQAGPRKAMDRSDLVIRGRRVVTKDKIGPASVHIRSGRITALADFEDIPSDCEIIEASDSSVVMPGLVDTHVHVNEPGRTEWEGFRTATRAAAAGGVTTIVDMPLNCLPATTTVGALEAKRKAASGQCHVDWMAWGGVVSDNQDNIED